MPASRRILVLLVAATALALGLAPPVFAGKTLDAVKARGEVSCGVNTSAPGFSSTDSKARCASRSATRSGVTSFSKAIFSWR